MRERRRHALMRRQLALSKIARREALNGLAGAVAEEDRSARLSERSRDLARDYQAQPTNGKAISLTDLGRFSAALARLANDAEAARADAERQAKWQAELLAAVDQKHRRFEERELEASRDLRAAIERRAAAPSPAMARKLQRSEQDSAGRGEATQRDKRKTL